jgi:hypothetical protein
MKFTDPKNPNEKKKMIAAAILGLAAILVLGYVFFGGSSTKTPPPANTVVGIRPLPSPRVGSGVQPPPETTEDPSIYQPVVYTDTHPAVSDPNRNIFAFYEPPPPTPKPVYVPTPTPTPTPPVTATSLSPSSVYAGTPADFNLQVTGDKFSPAVHVTLDGRDLPTRIVSSQQLFATVPAAMIANPGVRQVMVRNNDGQLYSNTLSLNISPAPTPNFNYVGLIGKPRFNDTAVLQDKSSKELLNVQRGDAVGGNFRVVSISEKEVILIDSKLKIRHRLGYTVDQGSNSPYRPPARTVDDEPNL